ncbi:NAD(P)-dependent oxidoreductase [Leuconostocaceae bacterium ESL0723]|nr:NAD(P)-dependent oxidoreductase [Leuconostocaceae bacterium ESL0723]
MKILLTGATGLLGRQFIANLSSQYEIYGIGRNQKIGQELTEKYPVHFIAMDLAKMTPADQKKLVDLAPDMIIHAAARSEYWGPKEWFEEANVVGTKNMLAVGQQADVQRFIQISSPSIYFRYETAQNVTETYPLPTVFANEYARTKAEADELVRQSGLPYIILRPRAIFGPHDETILKPLLERNAQGGIPMPTKGKQQWVDVTNVDNVVEAIRLSVETNNPDAINQAYNITNGDPRRMYDLLESLTQQLGVPLKFKAIPFRLLYWVGYLDEVFHRHFKKDQEPLLTRYVASVLGRTQTLSIKKAQDLLHYQPVKTVEEGIKEFVDANQQG